MAADTHTHTLVDPSNGRCGAAAGVERRKQSQYNIQSACLPACLLSGRVSVACGNPLHPSFELRNFGLGSFDDGGRRGKCKNRSDRSRRLQLFCSIILLQQKQPSERERRGGKSGLLIFCSGDRTFVMKKLLQFDCAAGGSKRGQKLPTG